MVSKDAPRLDFVATTFGNKTVGESERTHQARPL